MSILSKSSKKNIGQIVKANKVIEAGYHLTMNEQRLILLAISQIPKQAKVSSDEPYIITASEFAKYCNLHPKTAYRELQTAADKLFERVIHIPSDTQTAKIRWTSAVIADNDFPYDRISDDEEDGFKSVLIYFTPQILPYLSDLKNNFTQYSFSEISAVKGTYTVRFYELITQYKNVGERTISITDLRFMLALENKYPLFSDLRKRVIEPAIAEINDKTPIAVTWECVMSGKRVKAIKLKFKRRTTIDSTATEKQPYDGLSDAQLGRIANSKKFMSDYGELVSPANPANQSSDAWINHMVAWIKKDPSTFRKRTPKEYLDDEQAPKF